MGKCSRTAFLEAVACVQQTQYLTLFSKSAISESETKSSSKTKALRRRVDAMLCELSVFGWCLECRMIHELDGVLLS